MKQAVIASIGLVGVSGHICMWQPLQRNGAFEIVEPGQSICYLKQGPCGNIPSAEPLSTLQGGERFDVLFQQNLNHFYKENPGSIVVDFANVPDPVESDFTQLGNPITDWNAMNMITQTNFTIPVKVPNVDCDHCVLRVRYVSQNPTEDHGGSPTFHQCADVKVVKSDVPSDDDAEEVPDDKVTENDCCAPGKFTLEGYETGSGWRNPTKMKFFFDAENQLFRIDTNSGDGTTSKDGQFKMMNDFKCGIEYYYNVVTDVCELYGLNLWSDWCYGAVNSQQNRDTVRIGSAIADVWNMNGNDFLWMNDRASCTPISKVRQATGEATYYYNMQTELPSDYFALPQSCVDALAAAGISCDEGKRGGFNLTAAPGFHGFF